MNNRADRPVGTNARWARQKSVIGEMASMLVAGVIPLVGVSFFGWEAHSVMFLITIEVIAASAVLAWLFNYPARSSLAGIAFVLVLAPAGFLMLGVLAGSYPGRPPAWSEMVAELLAISWTAVTFILLRAVLFGRNSMAKALRTGTDYETNDRILITLLVSVFWPLLVFILVASTWETLGVVGLAVVLAGKTAADLGLFVWERRDWLGGR